MDLEAMDLAWGIATNSAGLKKYLISTGIYGCGSVVAKVDASG
jgi:hypothetical protein